MSIAPLEAHPGPEGERGLVQPRYDLNPAESSVAIQEYVSSHDVPQGFRFIGVAIGDEDGDITNAARTRECEVFKDAFATNDARWMEETYREADERGRRFLTVLDLGDQQKDEQPRVVGVMSVLDQPPYLSLRDAAGRIPYTVDEIRSYHHMRHEKIVDILTVAIDPPYRAKAIEGTSVMAMLEGMLVRVGLQEGWEHAVSMIDSKAWRVLDAIGAPFEPMHGYDTPFEYCGSPETYAMYGKFDQFAPAVAAKYNAYRRSIQRIRDVLAYTYNSYIGQESSPRFREAAKRLGIFSVCKSVITGKGVVDRVKLPEEALSLKLI